MNSLSTNMFLLSREYCPGCHVVSPSHKRKVECVAFLAVEIVFVSSIYSSVIMKAKRYYILHLSDGHCISKAKISNGPADGKISSCRW